MNQRIYTLTAEEMLGRWKLAGLYEPLLADATVECSDGMDLDRLLRLKIDSWYVRQLMEAPLESLPLTEIAGQLTLAMQPDGSARVSLPEGTLRVASAMMKGWLRPAAIITSQDSPEALAQSNPFSRGGSARPVAVINSDGSMNLYTPPPGAQPQLLSVKAVCLPEKGTYWMTDAMMADESIFNLSF